MLLGRASKYVNQDQTGGISPGLSRASYFQRFDFASDRVVLMHLIPEVFDEFGSLKN
jgi:hypothetical protein